MRKLLKTVLIVMLLSLSVSAQAQKLTKKEKVALKEQEKKALAEKDAYLHNVAVDAIENHQWAFEANGLYNDDGARINVASPQPNFAGFDGVKFFAFVIYRLNPYQVESNGKFISKKVDKKGNLVYKYMSYAPTRSESTLTVYKDTDAATISIFTDIGSVSYQGKVMPIRECWYFMVTERKPRK